MNNSEYLQTCLRTLDASVQIVATVNFPEKKKNDIHPISFIPDTFYNTTYSPCQIIHNYQKLKPVSFFSRYGDKVPKSIVARIFSIFWILFGLVSVAIFVANITSALTTLSLRLEPANLVGMKVCTNICFCYSILLSIKTRWRTKKDASLFFLLFCKSA